MQMSARYQPRGPDAPQYVTRADSLSNLDLDTLQVAVAAKDTCAVVNDDRVPAHLKLFGQDHDPRAGCANDITDIATDIYPRVVAPFSVLISAPRAELGGDLAGARPGENPLPQYLGIRGRIDLGETLLFRFRDLGIQKLGYRGRKSQHLMAKPPGDNIQASDQSYLLTILSLDADGHLLGAGCGYGADADERYMLKAVRRDEV